MFNISRKPPSPTKLHLLSFYFLCELPVCFQAHYLVTGGVGVATPKGKREAIIKRMCEKHVGVHWKWLDLKLFTVAAGLLAARLTSWHTEWKPEAQ